MVGSISVAQDLSNYWIYQEKSPLEKILKQKWKAVGQLTPRPPPSSLFPQISLETSRCLNACN